MQPAFFPLILIAVHVSIPADCAPRPQGPEQDGGPDMGAHSDTGRFYLELSGSGRKGIYRNLLVILPVRTEAGNYVSMHDLKRKRFICMNSQGELYNSRQNDREDCFFQRIWSDVVNHRDVFYSSSGGRLLQLDGAHLRAVLSQGPAEGPPGLMERILGSLVKRRRRSEQVNPSDPLRSQSHPPHAAQDHKEAEQDQAGAVSKETISSCDDPLRVLQHNGPVSPVKTNIADRAQPH